MNPSYRTGDVPVRGGLLRVAEWGPADGPVVVAVHGITASHAEWPFVADALPGVRLIAPDLRGRGRSNGLPGPFGMEQHAADLVAMLDALGIAEATLVGHSMGAFVTVVAAHLHPTRFPHRLLVDGGLPLAVPEGTSQEQFLAATLGPAAARLSVTFTSVDQYLGFWRQHPALGPDWSDEIEEYARYDLDGEAPELHPSCAIEAMTADSQELYGSTAVRAALESLSAPITLLTAPRGLQNETPGLYSSTAIETWRAELPLLRPIEVPDVNHYTIAMSPRGAAAIAEQVRLLLPTAPVE